jgi:hypothetical protein
MDVNLLPFRNQNREKWVELADSVSLDTPTVLDLKGWDQMPHASFYWSYLLLTPWRREAFDHLFQ